MPSAGRRSRRAAVTTPSRARTRPLRDKAARERAKLEAARKALRQLTGIGKARRNANEAAAIATLKNLSSAQAQTQACGIIDVNGNGAGEYGYFKELSGAINVRGDAEGKKLADRRMVPPVLSGRFANVKNGVVQRSGYCFRIFLPNKAMAAVAEAKTGGGLGCAVAPKMAEVVWCAYAWPVEWGKTGKRAFFIDQSGDVMVCKNAFGDYSGLGATPPPFAARKHGSKAKQGMSAQNAVQSLASDGQVWTVSK